MNISQRLRTCAKHTGLDAVIELLQEAADEIDALQARAALTQQPATGEPVAWIRRHLNGALSNELLTHVRVEQVRRDSGAWVPLYTHPAPSVRDDVVRDAKRYEWLRKADRWPCVFPDYFDPEPLAGSELDAAIDAAMLAAKERLTP